MRTWRVGTVSMGISLIFLGIFLILSQLLEWKPAYAMMAWWPIILIVLGVEILIFLFLAKKEHPIVKYDLFSIFFVGVVGFAGIGFMAVSATGILDRVNDWINYEVKTFDLPAYHHSLDKKIKRIVIIGSDNPLTIESGTADDLSIFGTYTVGSGTEELASAKDYVMSEEKGDTVYIEFKSPSWKVSPFGEHHERNMTLVIPSDIDVELEANHQYVNVHSREIHSNWTIENALGLDIQLGHDSDVTVKAGNIESIHHNDERWKLDEKANDEAAEYNSGQSGTYKLGKGTYVMNIVNASELFVTTK